MPGPIRSNAPAAPQPPSSKPSAPAPAAAPPAPAAPVAWSPTSKSAAPSGSPAPKSNYRARPGEQPGPALTDPAPKPVDVAAPKSELEPLLDFKKKVDQLAVKLPKSLFDSVQADFDALVKEGKTREAGALLNTTEGLAGFLNKFPQLNDLVEGFEKSSQAFDLFANFTKSAELFAKGEVAEGMKALTDCGGAALALLPDEELEKLGKMVGGDPKAFAKFAKSAVTVTGLLNQKPPEYAKAVTEGMTLVEQGLKALPKNGAMAKLVDGMTKGLGVKGEDLGHFLKAFTAAQTAALSDPPDVGKALGATMDVIEHGVKMLPRGGGMAQVLDRLNQLPGVKKMVELGGTPAKALQAVLNNSKSLVELYQNWDDPNARLRLIPEVAKELGPEIVGVLVQRATGSETAGDISNALTKAMANYVDDLGKQHIAANKNLTQQTAQEANAFAGLGAELVAEGKKLGLSDPEAQAFARLKRDCGPVAANDLLLKLRTSGNTDGLKAAVRQFLAIQSASGGNLLQKAAVGDPNVPAGPMLASAQRAMDALVGAISKAKPGSPERAFAEALLADQRALKAELTRRAE